MLGNFEAEGYTLWLDVLIQTQQKNTEEIWFWIKGTTCTEVPGCPKVDMVHKVMGNHEEVEPFSVGPGGNAWAVQPPVSLVIHCSQTPCFTMPYIPVIQVRRAVVSLQSQAPIAEPRLAQGIWRRPCQFFWGTPKFTTETDVIVQGQSLKKVSLKQLSLKLHLYHRFKLCIWYLAFRSALNEKMQALRWLCTHKKTYGIGWNNYFLGRALVGTNPNTIKDLPITRKVSSIH